MATPDQSPNMTPGLQEPKIETAALEPAQMADELVGKIALRLWDLGINLQQPSSFNLPKQEGWKRVSFVPAHVLYGKAQIAVARIIVNECYTDINDIERVSTDDFTLSLEDNTVLHVASDTTYEGTSTSGDIVWFIPPLSGPLGLLIRDELRLIEGKDYAVERYQGQRLHAQEVDTLTTLHDHLQPITKAWQDEVASQTRYIEQDNIKPL